MKKLALFSLLLLAFSTQSCTDAQMSKFKSLGNSANIKCYSGGVLIYEGTSTGKVSSEASSDGYFFSDKSDKRLKEVSGDCIIDYN